MLTIEQKKRSEEAYETTGCKECIHRLDNDEDFHCDKFKDVPLIVFEEGFCGQWVKGDI